MQDSNKMATAPVGRLIITMGLPSMLSMLVQALYNIVDSYFVAKLGESALTAVSLAFPVQMLIISVAVGTGVGLNSLVSRRLGEGDHEAAARAASHGIVLAMISAAVFALFGIFGPHAFISAFAEKADTIAMGVDYLSVVCIFSFGIFVQIAIEKILQGTGSMIWPMIFMLVGTVTNIILDPIMIFGLMGFPAMGVRGAAIATVAGQILACVVSVVVIAVRKNEVKISLVGFRFHKRTVRDIYAVGLPSIIMQSIASVMQMGLNAILIGFSEAAVSVLGAYFKLQSFVFLPVFGLTHGVLPVIGYNFGARHPARIRRAVQVGCVVAACIMLAGTAVFVFGAPQLMNIFNPSVEMLRIGVPALRIIAVSFTPAAISIIFSTFYQAVGKGFNSLWFSLLRQLIIILPLAWLLAEFSLNLVWAAFPFAEVLALIPNLIVFARLWRKIIAPMGEE